MLIYAQVLVLAVQDIAAEVVMVVALHHVNRNVTSSATQIVRGIV